MWCSILAANGTSTSRASQALRRIRPVEIQDFENNETREKLQMIRVKFLRLAHRLGQTPHNVVVAQVLYRLGLVEQLRGSRNSNRIGAFSFDRASVIAEQQEAAGQEGLDFTCTIMVLGKMGVGKSASINSIFDEVKSDTDAFHLGIKKSRAQLKMPEEQLGDEDVSEEELEDVSDEEDEFEYDKLPNFRPLKNVELNELSKEQKEAYYKEVEHREKLFMKKQLKEERQHRRLMRKMKAAVKEKIGNARNMEEENVGLEPVPVPMPDMALPPSFNAENPSHRYRYLDSESNQWLV
ncbi:hypothetical protein KI387_007386 [Taxus chinensis]|uniref:Translocase of chloroplast 159/132 membrane anchor domain-containing protein n=1 Tax=Taxus chinensis TaxID=29808 RepID=A0AA38GRX6_TAXCH|nr:hypothetical protein KI387_007386 [Taxus chinensis]